MTKLRAFIVVAVSLVAILGTVLLYNYNKPTQVVGVVENGSVGQTIEGGTIFRSAPSRTITFFVVKEDNGRLHYLFLEGNQSDEIKIGQRIELEYQPNAGIGRRIMDKREQIDKDGMKKVVRFYWAEVERYKFLDK